MSADLFELLNKREMREVIQRSGTMADLLQMCAWTYFSGQCSVLADDIVLCCGNNWLHRQTLLCKS